MALQLSLTTEEDVSANYWRITGLRLNIASQESFVELELYKTRNASNAGKRSLLKNVYGFSGSDYPFSVAAMDVANPITIAYEKLKTLPEFAEAVDV